MSNLDYDRLLDDWSDLVFKEMDEAKSILNNEPFGTPKFYRAKGCEDGLSMAMALLSTLEKRKRKKYEVVNRDDKIQNDSFYSKKEIALKVKDQISSTNLYDCSDFNQGYREALRDMIKEFK